MMENRIVFSLGMHKSGTSWLFEQFYQHPEIYTLQRDNHFFSKDSEFNRGLAYFSTMCSPDLLNIEMGNHYACSPSALRRIQDYKPDAKCILILRHPVERAISHHKQNIKTGTYSANISLAEAIANYQNIIAYSSVKNQVELVKSHIPEDNLLILSYNQISSDPESLLINLQSFLGLRQPFSTENSSRKVNTARLPKSTMIEQLQNGLFYRLQQNVLGRHIWATLKKMKLGSLVRRLNTSHEEVGVSQEELGELSSLLKDDIECYKSLFG